VRRALLVSAALFLIAGCDQDRFLSGQWVLEQPEIGDEVGLDAETLLSCSPGGSDNATCERWLELNLGHFGSAVVGTLRFFDSANRIEQKQSACSDANQCACQYIDAKLRNDELTFEYSDCAGVVHNGLIRVVSSTQLEWVLDPNIGDTGTAVLIPTDAPTSSDKVCVPECK
jgi:hypothetical protein